METIADAMNRAIPDSDPSETSETGKENPT
jgi:hypothetical protein